MRARMRNINAGTLQKAGGPGGAPKKTPGGATVSNW